ncbi:MAG: hypothetical protein LBO09_05055 [Candidatus Peribacteria bacterium]|jgi:hypothetical protein|nr:hypothetical protein [Candidatus Peribacteria bacterium]
MKTVQQSFTTPLLQGALWGIGLLSITGIGIISFNQLSSSPVDAIHNVSAEDSSENDEAERAATEERTQILAEIATLQQDISSLQVGTSGLQAEVATLQADTTLSEQIAALELQFASLESGFSTLFPLGTYIAVNGTVDQKAMNLLGWALCDGSAITSQVKDALL